MGYTVFYPDTGAKDRFDTKEQALRHAAVMIGNTNFEQPVKSEETYYFFGEGTIHMTVIVEKDN
jgi:hypothetical protein